MATTIPSLILPPEIILIIAECLGHDVKSISNLYKANKSTRQIICSRLYQSVHLRSVNGIVSLCHILTNSRPDELKNIRSLQIGLGHSAAYKIQSNLTSLLCSALEAMPHLFSLSLFITSAALDNLVELLDPPFQLTEFVHCGELSPPLARFLQKQPFITKLEWHSLFLEDKRDYLSTLLEDSQNLLPVLTELAGPIPLLSALIPRRPITKIQIMYHVLSFLRLENSTAGFSCPMERLSSIRITEHRSTWQSFTALISTLKDTCVRNTLKEVHVVEAFTGYSLLAKRNAIRTHVIRLADFNSLEHLEISCTPNMSVSPQLVYERLRLDEMDRVSNWRTIIPSLKSVTIHDYKLC